MRDLPDSLPPEAARVVYLDNAATSWPKPRPVAQAVARALDEHGASPGRGVHALGLATSSAIFRVRAACAAFLGVGDARDLVFVPGCTAGTNLMLKGLLEPGHRVVVSSMEHNAVSRPLTALASAGVTVDVVQADGTGTVDAEDVERAVAEEPTRAVVCQHVSNVTGSIQPVADLADIAHEAGALLLVDGAQAVGHVEVDVAAIGADAYAISGHKGLLGPAGTGLLYLAPGVEARELVQGGTGTRSESQGQPTERPARYESGTPNTPGILGLGAAVGFLKEVAGEIREREDALARMLIEGFDEIPGVTVHGPAAGRPRVPIVSITHETVDADRLAFLLDRRFHVAVRAGLHCAPWAHRTIGTTGTGAVRFGVGWANDEEDVRAAVAAVRELVS